MLRCILYQNDCPLEISFGNFDLVFFVPPCIRTLRRLAACGAASHHQGHKNYNQFFHMTIITELVEIDSIHDKFLLTSLS